MDNQLMDACLARRGFEWVIDDEETRAGHLEPTGPNCDWETIDVKHDRCKTCGLTYTYP